MKKYLTRLAFLVVLEFLISGQTSFAQTATRLAIQRTNAQTTLVISGTASNACTLQYATNLTALNPWHYLAYFRATNDPSAFSATNQFPGGAGLGFLRNG